jgi:glucose/mannose-6-phosphate isomerase
LISFDTLEKNDRQKMFAIYDKWPELAQEAAIQNDKYVDFGSINHIVFAGMGGSGTIGDLFAAILSKTKIHVSVIKGYQLPKTITKNTLVITTSISGNTVETLTILDAANKLDCKLMAFSSGGKMKEYCKKKNISYKNVKYTHSPRASFVGFLYTMLHELEPIINVKKYVDESIRNLKQLRENICSSNISKDNISLSLALWVKDIPIIYYPWGLQSAAIRFKNSLQENSKQHAIAEDVIEACHNGIVAWEKNSNVQPIIIHGEDDYYKTKERYIILKEYFSENKIEFKEIKTVKGNILSKLIYLIYLLDYTSIYLAVINQIDPSPVKSIDFIKKRL